MSTKKEEKIINSTIKLFLQNGVRKISMDEIANYSNVSKVTIYKYFTDKDTLYFEIGRRIFSEYREKLSAVVSDTTSLIQRIYDFLDIITEFQNSGRMELCRELSKANKDVEEEHMLYLQQYKNLLLILIDEGSKAELFKSDLSRELIFHYIDMGVVFYYENADYRNKMISDHNFQTRFMTFYIGNIFVDSSKILNKNEGDK